MLEDADDAQAVSGEFRADALPVARRGQATLIPIGRDVGIAVARESVKGLLRPPMSAIDMPCQSLQPCIGEASPVWLCTRTGSATGQYTCANGRGIEAPHNPPSPQKECGAPRL